MFANWIHERVNLSVGKFCNSSPRAPSFSVGKLEFSCDKNSYYNMVYDFDPNRPDFIRANKDGYSRIFVGMALHDVVHVLPLQEVHMEYDGIGAHLDDLSLCGRMLVDKKFLSKVEGWTNKYLPRSMHSRQISFYRAVAKYGTLLSDVVVDGKVLFEAGETPGWNVKKVYIVYMPMSDPLDVRVAVPPNRWLNMPVKGCANKLLEKKDTVEEHMLNNTVPLRSYSFECTYCRWYDKCHNMDVDYDEPMPDYLLHKLDILPSLGGGD